MSDDEQPEVASGDESGSLRVWGAKGEHVQKNEYRWPSCPACLLNKNKDMLGTKVREKSESLGEKKKRERERERGREGGRETWRDSLLERGGERERERETYLYV